jgi:PKHD-type hydroxylase
MLIEIPVLTPQAAAELRARLLERDWESGAVTAGHQSVRAKHNQQLPADDPVAGELGEALVAAWGRIPTFVAAALPRRVFPPVFSRYRPGDGFGSHVDNAIRHGRGGSIRTDLSATLFLTPLDQYDGGALLIEDRFGPRRVRLEAGTMVLYPSSSVHGVEPVTSGERIAAVTWIQSLVRDDGQRTLLLELDQAIQSLSAQAAGEPAVIALTGIYHNLIRRWADL